jgi:hypothetical protein
MFVLVQVIILEHEMMVTPNEFRAKYVREVYGGFEFVYDSAVRVSKEGGSWR